MKVLKQFLIKLSILVLPLLLLSYPVDLWFSSQLKKSNEPPGEYEVMNDIYSGEMDCQLAIYGSSRAWVHINPEILQDKTGLSAYNFGIDGHNFWMQYLRHLEFQKHNEKPSVIVLSVDVYTFQKEANLYYQNQFLPYMLWNNTIREYTSSYNGFSFIEYLLPSARYAGEKDVIDKCFEIYQADSIVPAYRTLGFKGMEKSWNQDYANAKAKETVFTVEIHEPSIELFESFLKECKADDIDVVMVYTPEHVFGQKYVANRAAIFKIFDGISKDKEIPFLDYSQMEICKDTSFFYNASHLNVKGVEVFNAQLIKDLVTLGISDKSSLFE